MSLDFHAIARGGNGSGEGGPLTPSLIPPKDDAGDFTPTQFSVEAKEESKTPLQAEQSMHQQRSLGDRDLSFISNIQRDKDASYLMLNQTVSNMSAFMPQNSFYLNASFLRPNNQAQPRGSADSVEDDAATPVKGGKFFSGLNPRLNTGQSKIDVTSAAPGDASAAQVLDQEAPNRFTLGNDNMFGSALLNSGTRGAVDVEDQELSELYR